MRLGASLCGRYRVETLIGLGGMSAVYAGRHRNGHAVAIKILHERFRDAGSNQAVRREARLANTIEHPVIVPVIDDDMTEDGCVFLVMPLLRGETLRARAARLGGKLHPFDVITATHALLGAVGAAHALGIVHRDIKPENVFATDDGAVRLLDFGIGRSIAEDDSSLATHSGRTIGTPAFMSPEHARGRRAEIDGRSDLWSLGAMMYTLLSGRFVHEAETSAETMAFAATRAARPLGEVAPNVPGPLRDVVDRALSPLREGRFQTADAMARALEEACERAFGRLLASLPPLVSRASVVDGPDLLATERPLDQGGIAGDGASIEALLSHVPTTTSPVSAVAPQGAPFASGRPRTRLSSGRALAFSLLAVGGLAFAVASVAPPKSQRSPQAAVAGAEPPGAPVVQVAPQEAPPVVAPPKDPVAVAPPKVPVAVAPPRVPIAVALSKPKPAPAERKASSNPSPSKECDPPYSLDDAGHHVYRPECM